MKKHILFVDDESNVLQGLKRMLRGMRHEWNMVFAESGTAALETMAEQDFDVVVTDMRMPEMNGVELLEEVKKRHPETVRIVLSGHSDTKLILKSVRVAHQYISKPTDAGELKDKISRSCALLDLLQNKRLLQLVSNLEAVPTLPEVYMQVVEELEKEEPAIGRVGRIISRDPAMAAKVLQLVNSSFFGIPRHIESPVQAVTLLGLDTVKPLVLAVEVFSKFDSKKIPSRDLERIWDHSVKAGAVAQALAKDEGLDKSLTDDACMAGLLHDLGKPVLMDNFPEDYSKILRTYRKSGGSLYHMEHEAFGVSHAEIGAYLLGLWGLPENIVEAVGFHHTPDQCPFKTLTPLLLVHVANALTQAEAEDRNEDGLIPEIDAVCLERLGLEDRLPGWTVICREVMDMESEG
ncbi:MAG: HDOD domain-containing protein [Desulfohalobiaceae bacterium]|nr:HDOD domain-containing protein [Desulfohalobiaceae bacterium]